MELNGGRQQGEQSSTIYGYRAEYKPSQKTDARSMVRAVDEAVTGSRCLWRGMHRVERAVLVVHGPGAGGALSRGREGSRSTTTPCFAGGGAC